MALHAALSPDTKRPADTKLHKTCSIDVSTVRRKRKLASKSLVSWTCTNTVRDTVYLVRLLRRLGFKTRTFPVAVTGGLMWHGGDGRAGMEALRHECSEGDGLGPYGWVEHDGVSYGKQEVVDDRAGVRLVTSMVKPAQLTGHNAAVDGRSDGESGLAF